MILRDVAVHAQHEEAAALLAIIRKSVRLTEPQSARSEWLERTLEGRCRSNRVEHARDGRVDRIRKTLRGCEIEHVNGLATVGSITEDAVLRFRRQNLASSNW